LIPLYARAVETHKTAGVLRDQMAVEMVDAIDFDFTRYEGARSLFSCAVRTVIFDSWIEDFLTAHPGGTVIEIGAGLNTRYERLDNGGAHWIDIDLPDVIELRRRFFKDNARRRMVAASVLEPSWVETAKSYPAPYFLAAEASILYLEPAEAETALRLIANCFPGSRFMLDTWGRWWIENQRQQDLLKNEPVAITWACDDPKQLERIAPNLHLADSRTLSHVPSQVKRKLPVGARLAYATIGRISPQVRSYRFNVFDIGGIAGPLA
jgi:O-methyltransferase involved in polyketide biosynthesis